MYRFMSRFMTYRRYYLWRARIRYFTHDMDTWTLACLVLMVCMGLMVWGFWRVVNVPQPRIHPEAAAVRVEVLTDEAIHRIVLVRHGGTTPGDPFYSAAEIRGSTQRTLRVRQTLQDPVAMKLQADMYADIADYINATGACMPFPCRRVSFRIEQLQRSGHESAVRNKALAEILQVPWYLVPNLDGERTRVRSGWADDFQDVYSHAWNLHDLQKMHARMMAEYPYRAAVPWLARLATPAQEQLIFP